MKNKELVAKLFQEVLNQRNVSPLDNAYDSNVVDHSAWEGQAPGLTGIKNAVNGLFESYPELKVTVEDIFAEGNKVVTRESWKATEKSTGKTKSGSVIHIFWFKNGKVTDEWSSGWEWMDK